MTPVGPASPATNVTLAEAGFHTGPAYTFARDIRGPVHDGAPELVEEISPLGVHTLDQPQIWKSLQI